MCIKRVKELFWSKVRVAGLDDCWEWTASLTVNGYGRFSSGRNYGVPQHSNRTVWHLTHGLIPPGLDILHSCDNRKCCNPTHLRLGHIKTIWRIVTQGVECTSALEKVTGELSLAGGK